jgi:peptide/nickel transport system substrate-binding protein
MKSKRVAALGLVAIGALALGAGSAVAVDGNIVVLGEDQQPEGLNQISLGGASVVTHRVLCPIQCENLLGFTKDYKYVGVLAETVPSRSNGGVKVGPPFTVTFKINKAAKWSDGKPVTSGDAEFTWRTMIDPKFKAASRTGWDQIKSISTSDPSTVVVTFKKPYAAWRDIFSPSGGGVLLPKHILQGQDFNTVWNDPSPSVLIGTGPYVLQSYKKDDSAILVPNKNYWKGTPPKVDRIVFSFLKSTTGQDVAYQNGEVNFFNTPAFGLVPQFRKLPNSKVDSVPGTTWEHLAFNTEDPLMKDVNVRKAIAAAVNPAELIKSSAANQVFKLESFLVPQQKPFSKSSWAGASNSAAKVARFLRASGYAKNAKGKWAKGGKELVVTFTTIAGNTTRENNFKLMKKQLEKNGIGFKSNFDDNFFDANGSLNTGKFQVGEFAWQGSADPSSTQLFRSDVIPTAKNPSGQNVYRYKSKVLDKLLSDSDQAVVGGTRVSLMKKIQDHIANNMLLMPLYQRPEVNVYAGNLSGVITNPTQVGSTDVTEGWAFSGGKTVR